MFSWFRRKKSKAPAEAEAAAANLGQDVKLAFTDGVRTWSEHVNLIDIARRVLSQHSHRATAHESWLTLDNSGLVIRPALEGFQPIHRQGAETVTTIEVSHPAINAGRVFEFQHAAGDSVAQSIAKGFDDWAKMDLVTLLESLRPKPIECTMMEWQFPATDALPVRNRRAILGPVAHFCERPSPSREVKVEGEDEHDFCPCCLLTKSYDAFKELLEDDGFYGIRLLAMRDENGAAGADCRVNGNEWEVGKEALRRYVATWSDAGFEMRKQYVVICSVGSSPAEGKSL